MCSDYFQQRWPALFTVAGESHRLLLVSVLRNSSRLFHTAYSSFCLQCYNQHGQIIKGLHTHVWRLCVSTDTLPYAVASLEIYVCHCSCARNEALDSCSLLSPNLACAITWIECNLYIRVAKLNQNNSCSKGYCKYLQQLQVNECHGQLVMFTVVLRWKEQCLKDMSHKEVNERKRRWAAQRNSMVVPIVLIKPLGKSLHVHVMEQSCIEHLLDFPLSALIALNCTPASLEHVCPLCTTQTTTSPSWALKNSIHLMQGSGGKSFTSWKVRETEWQMGRVSPWAGGFTVDQRGKERQRTKSG